MWGRCGSFRKWGVPYFGVLIIRILLFKGTILGSPIFGNPLMGWESGSRAFMTFVKVMPLRSRRCSIFVGGACGFGGYDTSYIVPIDDFPEEDRVLEKKD